MGMTGCMENIALIGRPSIAEGENDDVGEIERVDLFSRRIYLRTDRGGGRAHHSAPTPRSLSAATNIPCHGLNPATSWRCKCDGTRAANPTPI